MADMIGVIGSVLAILNNTSIVTDPYNGTRVGSFFFDQDHQMNFNKYMPKGQVTDDNTEVDRYSFGSSKRLRKPQVNVYFYTLDGDKDSSTGFKNRALVYDYMERIEDAINNNMDQMGIFRNASFEDTGKVTYDRSNKIYWGVKPIIFSRVKKPT